ncbi:MAG: hypothetical protein V7K14_00530 [Nostoc sp.]
MVSTSAKTLLKPRFQPEAGNAARCGSAASLEAPPQGRALRVGDS